MQKPLPNLSRQYPVLPLESQYLRTPDLVRGDSDKKASHNLTSLEASPKMEVDTFEVWIAHLKKADSLAWNLKSIPDLFCCLVKIVEKPTHDDTHSIYAPEEQEAIWVGSHWPARLAIKVIQEARRCFTNLKYIGITSDLSDVSPELDDRLIIGATTTVALTKIALKRWTKSDFLFTGVQGNQAFHNYIRQRYCG